MSTEQLGILIDQQLSLWELAATFLIAQQYGASVKIHGQAPDGQAFQLAVCTEIPYWDSCEIWHGAIDTCVRLEYAQAYRFVEQVDWPYPEVLAFESGYPRQEILPLKLNIPAASGGGIILVPSAPKQELQLPASVWVNVVRHLRSYGRRVYLLQNPGERMDAAMFSEAEILSELPVSKKLEAVAAADLVVGVPNEWMWFAASFEKNVVQMYPEGVPPKRWFWFASQKFGRLLYNPHQMQVPVILAGMRKLIYIL